MTTPLNHLPSSTRDGVQDSLPLVSASCREHDHHGVAITDAFLVGDIDFSDPIAVRRELDKTTLSGTLFSDEGIAAACRAGRLATCPQRQAFRKQL